VTPSPAPPTPQPAAGERASRVGEAVKAWQRHLVDLGGRNTLLWHRDTPPGSLDLTTAHPGGLAMLLAGRPTRLSDLVREPAALDDARRRARAIRAKTLELEQERGLRTGFIAIGMATWTLPGASRAPAAPVLLRACSLTPTDAAHEDFDIDLGEEAELNPVLEHYLRSQRRIELDGAALEGLATAGSAFDPAPVYAALRHLCADVPDFEITPRLVVSTFSYAKLPMVADLAEQGPALAAHDVIAALAGDPGARSSLAAEVPDVEPDPDPARELLVLDADTDQQAVVEAARAGRSLLVHGPPGTGKSQTIANLAAALAFDGRRVLVVSQRRAALRALQSRLAQAGLGDLVMEAHEGAEGRRRIATALGAGLERATGTAPPEAAADTGSAGQELLTWRSALQDHTRCLHERREPWGVSVHEAQEAIAALSAGESPPASRTRVRGEQLAALPRARMEDLAAQLADAAALGAWSVEESADPWRGARIATEDEAERAREITSRLSGGGLREVQEGVDEVFSEVTLLRAERVSDWGEVMDTVARVRDTLEVFRPEVFDIPLGDLVAAAATPQERESQGVSLGWLSRLRLRRQARGLLRPGRPPEDLHAALAHAQQQRTAWYAMAGAGGRPEIPVGLDQARAAYQSLAEDLAWLGERLASTSGGGELLGVELPALQARLEELAGSQDRLALVPRVLPVMDELAAAGLGPLVDDLARRRVEPGAVRREVEHVWWASIVDEVAARDPRYGEHDGDRLRQAAREYAAGDHAHLRACADRVREAVRQRLGAAVRSRPKQVALLREEAGRAVGHRATPELFTVAGPLLTAIRPVWALSPLTVASIVPPGEWFDVVVFDEASQTAVAEAASAISRARQVVVVGDGQQLLPAPFQTAAVEHEPASAVGARRQADSVLEALAGALPSRRLRWHYRSWDERLIAFPNAERYGGSLRAFPAAGSEPVLRVEPVEGSAVLQRGVEAIESTEAEVARVVELALEHTRGRPRESLGIVALSAAHASRIEDELRRALAGAAGTGGVSAGLLAGGPRGLFVATPDRVQGEERDAIILAVGYGRTPHGRVLHRFGSLGEEGGERALTVALTRARRRMTVVTSVSAEDLDPSRLKSAGPRMLRDWLADLAADAPDPASQGDVPVSAASPLVADLLRRLREAGLVARAGHGLGPHPVEIAVEHPHHRGRMLVAVETDGAAYAAVPSTRERERLRTEQLRERGWEHVRVWSTDLFRDPARDVARVLAAVNRAASADATPAAGAAPARDTAEPEAASEGTGQAPGAAAAPRRRSPARRRARRALEQSRDDTDEGWGERRDDRAHERWLQEQRPPHWGTD
jgi:hypothetical protein